MKDKKFIKLTPFKMQVLQSFPFIDEDFDAITNYELLCKVVEYLNKTVENVDLLNEKVEEFEHYFDNLDVQEEINNKLDEMAESGELTDIIAQYLGLAGVLAFNTVSDMKNATNLVNGSICRTLGYYNKNDNGGSYYYITNESLTANDGNIISISNNLFAILINENNSITPEMFGCYGDGTHDDTVKMQLCIDYAIENKKQINFTGNYKVLPKTMEDGSKVCLTLYRDSSTEIHGTDTGISFNFIRESSIFTDSTEECTLIRLNIANINFENALLKGVRNKTTLLELSKIDKLDTTESQWSCYNIFRNLMLLYCKTAISMEGNTYYNTFDKVTIRYCENGILLDFTELEKRGIVTGSNVNRNDFSNITIQQSTGKGIIINYGDTNKFINISFEGCVDCLYLDDPKKHTSDFPLTPSWYTEQNMFINIIAEDISGVPIYNNSDGLKIINTSIRYQDINNNFLIKPQLYLGGANNSYSIEKIMDIYKTQEELPVEGITKYSTFIDSYNGTVSKYYSDFQKDGTTYKTLSRRNILFNEDNIVNKKNGTVLVYESTYKCITKQIGGIVFLSSKFNMQPDNLTSNIELPLDTEITANNQLHQYLNIPPISVPISVYINGVPTLVNCVIKTNKLVLYPPTNGWSNTITVCLNLHWFRDTLPL